MRLFRRLWCEMTGHAFSGTCYCTICGLPLHDFGPWQIEYCEGEDYYYNEWRDCRKCGFTEQTKYCN